jgi:hypothetical protein
LGNLILRIAYFIELTEFGGTAVYSKRLIDYQAQRGNDISVFCNESGPMPAIIESADIEYIYLDRHNKNDNQISSNIPSPVKDEKRSNRKENKTSLLKLVWRKLPLAPLKFLIGQIKEVVTNTEFSGAYGLAIRKAIYSKM